MIERAAPRETGLFTRARKYDWNLDAKSQKIKKKRSMELLFRPYLFFFTDDVIPYQFRYFFASHIRSGNFQNVKCTEKFLFFTLFAQNISQCISKRIATFLKIPRRNYLRNLLRWARHLFFSGN